MTNRNPQRAVLANCRLSYVALMEPRAPQGGGDPKYQVTVLLPKTDTASKQRLDSAIKAAIQAGPASKWNGSAPARPDVPLHDGDGLRPSGEEFGPECKGHWVFTVRASEAYKPQVIGPSGEPIMSASDVYSGMYGHVSMQAYPYNFNGKKGIGFSLEAVQKTRDGEPLGSSTPDAANLFAELGAQAATEQQQAAPFNTGGYIDPITGLPM